MGRKIILNGKEYIGGGEDVSGIVDSINTTEQTPRNIADVLAEELARIAGAITTSESVEDILSDMATTKDAQVISGTVVFDTIDGNLVKALKVAITPSQAGSGTPSPSNIRPISGYTEEVISVKDSTDTTQETYTTAFGQTVYGGTLDVLTGELTIDKAMQDLGALDYTYNNSQFRSTTALDNALVPVNVGTNADAISSMYEVGKYSLLSSNDFYLTIVFQGSYAEGQVWVKNSNYTNPTDFKSAMSGVQLCYTLATPTTIQLTPQTVKALVRENHIMASTGDVTECKFSMLINGDDLAQIMGG